MNSSESRGPSFLIVCFRMMGDVLITTPLALSIKKAYPDAQIDYLVFKGTDKAIAKNPDIRNIITIPKGSWGLGILKGLFRKYDVAIAANPSDRTVMAAAIAGKTSFGLTYGRRNEWWKCLLLNYHQVVNDRLHIVTAMQSLAHTMAIEPAQSVVIGYDDSDLAFARQAVPFEHYILLHPYSMKKCKYWPAENWAKLAGMILDKTCCIPVFTKTPEPEGAGYLECILKNAPPGTKVFDNPCSLNQLAAAIKGATAFVGIDTAITHVAAALEIPTIAIFGPTMTRYWAPWPNGCRDQSPFLANKGLQHKEYVSVIQKDWECVPCNRETCAISTRNKMECLEEITPAEVFKEVLESVSRNHQRQPV